MPSKARLAFDENAADVRRLLEIHSHLGGTGQGRRYRLEVLNKSAIVLITAFWEAYCEDLAAEGLEHIVKHASNSSSLAPELRKIVAKELKSESHDLAVWKLADQGWRSVLENRLLALSAERNRRLNTPKSENIVELFKVALGIPDISARWSWKGMSVVQAKAKLDRYIELRGSIAHRGKSATTCKKAWVKDYFARRLVAKTGGTVKQHVKAITSVKWW